MTSPKTIKFLFRLALPAMLLSLFVLAPVKSFPGDANQDHGPTAVVDKPNGHASGHGHHHGHNHDSNDGRLRPAAPTNNLSPEQLARQADKNRQALAQAEKIYHSMEVNSTVAALNMGFNYDDRFFDMGMTLEQALIKMLAGGNRCRFKNMPHGKSGCQLDIFTDDKRHMTFNMKAAGDRLLIQSMTLRKLDGKGGIKENGARGAFYLMTLMRSR